MKIEPIRLQETELRRLQREFLLFSLLGVTVLWSVGCCSTNLEKAAPYVTVRESQFRTEISESDRLKLPLSADDRNRLLGFLRAGGNSQLIGKGIVAPEADKKYAELLAFLSAPEQISDVIRFKTNCFTVGPLYEVIDARNQLALSDTQVIAMGDGYYWWIFYHPTSKRLEGLLVTRAVGAKPLEH